MEVHTKVHALLTQDRDVTQKARANDGTGDDSVGGFDVDDDEPMPPAMAFLNETLALLYREKRPHEHPILGRKLQCDSGAEIAEAIQVNERKVDRVLERVKMQLLTRRAMRANPDGTGGRRGLTAGGVSRCLTATHRTPRTHPTPGGTMPDGDAPNSADPPDPWRTMPDSWRIELRGPTRPLADDAGRRRTELRGLTRPLADDVRRRRIELRGLTRPLAHAEAGAEKRSRRRGGRAGARD